jgi:ribonucleoside-diphosphate reductase beta chain
VTLLHAELHGPQQLYRQWEAEQWSPFAIDLAADREQWTGMSGRDRDLVLWALSSLMVAEERITTKFAALIMAGDSEEETTFLATQQVDEARHMQHYARFQDEVIADPQTIAVHVARSREQLGAPFAVIFDEALVEAHDTLASSPADRAAKVAFVTTYHLVIEATLGLTAFEFITRFLEREALLPGFAEGYSKIHHDEQRHIGYGIWFLRSAVRDDAALADQVRQTLRRLLPATASALAPPDSEGTDFEALGASSAEIQKFALRGLSRRLDIVGVPLSTL